MAPLKRIQTFQELKDPMLRMQRLLTERAIAEAVGKMEFAKGDKGDKGDRGDDGYTPIKGKDYFTDDEVIAIINYVQSNVKPGEKGDKGDRGLSGYTPVKGTDYFTKAERQALISDVLSKVPKHEEVKPEDVVDLVLKELKLPDTKELISKSELAEFLRRGGFRGGGDTVIAGSGISITINDVGQKVVAATGSGAFTILTATGSVNDTNTTFTFVSVPSMVNINGSFYNAGAQVGGVAAWTNVGTTVTTAFPVGTGGCIFGIA